MKITNMQSSSFTKLLSCCWILLLPVYAWAQHPATIKEYEKVFTTYPFSEPDPVPSSTNIYPYFRFDGYTDKPVQQRWKVVELENDFIKLSVMPQIGGKIWTAVDKQNGKPFIYDNDVVKFRDVAMRGPWTSGGLEANFGMFGHTPNVATPVDYITRKNPDGSVSCIVGVLDLLTQTRWSMEINLPKDKAYFITRMLWHNGTGIDQPYYTWMNLGVKVSDSLEYIEPGNHYLGHDGSVHGWPYDDSLHKPISIYAQNDFGSYKSYHVTGVYSEYFGAFWQKENYGMIHYAARQDKIGKKVWIWGLSPQGMIWEKLLTDHAGQYSELQSGRLYNQNAPESVLSPFKQISFEPYNTDAWSEYWYPFQHTGGVAAADLNGVINLKQDKQGDTVFVSSISYIHDSLQVFNDKGKRLFSKAVTLEPLQSFAQYIPLEQEEKIGKIMLAGTVVNIMDSAARILDRPLEPYPDFDWNSAYGLYLKGKYVVAYRNYADAEANIRASLEKDPAFIPSLDEMAFLQYRQSRYDSAFYYARRALSIDTYDPAANYYYGLAAAALHKEYDAEDGFQVATISPGYRAAAYTELSKLQLRQQHYEQAYRYAAAGIAYNMKNITALQLQYLSARLANNSTAEENIKKQILQLDPLNHFIGFENYWQHRDYAAVQAFTGTISNELPSQTYLDLAVWYAQLNRPEEAAAVLRMTPQKDDEILYWQAYLHRNDATAHQWLNAAEQGSPLMVFPFRRESIPVVQWAMQQSKDWKPQYYLALIEAFYNHRAAALDLLTQVSAPVNFAPFYIARARLRDSTDTRAILEDYSAAVALDKKDWRYGKYLAGFLLSQKQYAQALQVIAPYYRNDPGNYIAGIWYARCLLRNDQYADAEKLLDTLHILPYEGATEGHQLYEQTKLMRALELLRQKQYKTALQKVNEAREWPERLGVGAPYPDMADTSLEAGIEKLIRQTMKSHRLPEDEMNAYAVKIKAANDM